MTRWGLAAWPRRVASAVMMAGTALWLLAAPPALAATKIVSVTSPGGIEAWLVEEPSIPIIALDIAFRGGTALDPADKQGLAHMVSALLDEGAGDLDALAFQSEVERRAIRLGFDARMDSFGVQFKTLSRHRDRAFELLGLALARPRFDGDAVERIRGQILANLARRSENPNAVASRAWFAKAFPDHAYGRPSRGTRQTVAAITADDLRGFVQTRFARDNVLIGAVGDVSPDELGRLLDRALGALPARAGEDTVSAVEAARDGVLSVIRKANPQSVVMFGLAAVKRDDPDYYAAYLLNYALGGGGFTSRLYREVREKRGLAYSVYSYLNPFRHSGLLIGGVGTSNERVAESLALIRSEMRRLSEEGVSAQELADAKSHLNGAFPLRLTSSDGIAAILTAMQLHGLGINYIERRAGYINAVNLYDIRRIARRVLRPDGLIVVVVGDPKGLDDDASGG